MIAELRSDPAHAGVKATKDTNDPVWYVTRRDLGVGVVRFQQVRDCPEGQRIYREGDALAARTRVGHGADMPFGDVANIHDRRLDARQRRVRAFRVQQKEVGTASLQAGDAKPLNAISEFGAKPYTEEEAKALSAIVASFNERHGTQFTEEDFLRLEQVKRKASDEEMTAVLRNNPPDVARPTFLRRLLEETIKQYQRDSSLQSIIMTNADDRDRIFNHLFSRALREVREGIVG